MNLLILRLSSMGDVIHTLPALRALRQSFPDATIGWVVEDAHSTVLRGLPEIDHLYILNRSRLKGGWSEKRLLAKEMKSRLREVEWDVAIDFQGLWKSYLVARWSKAKRILGYAPSPEKTHWLYTDTVRLPTMDRHAVDRNLDLIQTLGASVRHAESRTDFRRDFSLPVSPGDEAAAEQVLTSLDIPPGNPKILLNFAARKEANKWGTRQYASLAKALLEEGMTPILTGGPSDIEEEQEIQNLIGAPVPSIVGKCNLMQLAAIMERADLLVTGDTGPMHIAAAMELPIVALFGPANPVRTGPYAPDSIVLQKPRDCQPCYARHCKFGEEPPPCLLDITVEEVVGEIQKALSKAPSMME
ncbi:MAG: glycosyltransferase family 9 protein [Candidatus Omnitrophica bacterium]|nr:glycosyltransferase family 9 protein [Candidatus Omnitrophota bacterium]